MTITEQQLNARHKGLGSSDIPAIFGVDPWKTARDLWLVKTGRSVPDDAGDAAYIGTHVEPSILAMAADRLGIRVVAPSSTFTRGILRANVDGMVGEFRRGSDIVEAKMSSNVEGWGRDREGDVPERVRLQVHHQMLCSESDTAHVALLLVAFRPEFRLLTVHRDDELCREIESRAEEWWDRHVKAGIEPAGDASPALLRSRRREPGSIIQVPAFLFDDERSASEACDVADSRHKSAQLALVSALGDSECGECMESGYRVTMKPIVSKRLDSKMLKANHPGIAAECTVESTSVRCVIGKLKQAT